MRVSPLPNPHAGLSAGVSPMDKTALARKKKQRAAQAAAGNTKVEIILDAQELEMLDHDCKVRLPGREPYSRAELIQMMIRKYHTELQRQLSDLQKRQCEKCKECLPVQECPCAGDSSCWVTAGWKETILTIY